MSWVSKFGKESHTSAMDLAENDIQINDVSLLRVGSAHATEGSPEVLTQLLEKFVQEINLHYDNDPEKNEVLVKYLSGQKE
jgi:hypothetical protein